MYIWPFFLLRGGRINRESLSCATKFPWRPPTERWRVAEMIHYREEYAQTSHPPPLPFRPPAPPFPISEYVCLERKRESGATVQGWLNQPHARFRQARYSRKCRNLTRYNICAQVAIVAAGDGNSAAPSEFAGSWRRQLTIAGAISTCPGDGSRVFTRESGPLRSLRRGGCARLARSGSAYEGCPSEFRIDADSPSGRGLDVKRPFGDVRKAAIIPSRPRRLTTDTFLLSFRVAPRGGRARKGGDLLVPGEEICAKTGPPKSPSHRSRASWGL